MMEHPAKVPQFGNWEDEEITYTICFDNARKGKKNDPLYPNDHHGNEEVESKGQKLSASASPKHGLRSSKEGGEMRRPTRSPLHPNITSHEPAVDAFQKLHGRVQPGYNKQESETLKALEAHRFRHDHQRSGEEGDVRRFTESPLHYDRRMSSEDNTPTRVSRQSAGSNRSVEHSPRHPHSQARDGGRGIGFSSPSWERKATSEGSHSLAPLTPGRSRLRSVTRGDDTPDHSPTIPKFGEWDETDPASAEQYSVIFSRVKEEKQNDSGKVPVMPTETTYVNSQKHNVNGNAKACGCFPWGKR